YEMMVVILTPVDGIIRWLPRGFSCSPFTHSRHSIALPEVIGYRLSFAFHSLAFLPPVRM
ncbi:hypothetical protein K1J29_23815, partial [Enterobacter hormaechei]|uniref:hypothetical protein n=1 Tax=Enterobacter hormaechei TaxID=158836 RepID=UPI001C6425AD